MRWYNMVGLVLLMLPPIGALVFALFVLYSLAPKAVVMVIALAATISLGLYLAEKE